MNKSKTYLSIAALILLLAAGVTALSSSRPAHPKWVQLFNGKDLKDWTVKIRTHEVGDNYANTFRVEDGMMQVRYDGYTQFEQQYGHIFYKKPFSYYLLQVEYRFVG